MKTETKAERHVRAAAVAGRFYPGEPRVLRETVENLLASAARHEGASPLAIVAPHAGYMYSGPIAASAYTSWEQCRGAIRRVLLIGPAHFVEVNGLAASSAGGFETPLGLVPVDTEAVDMLVEEGIAEISDQAHQREHSLEVQLPFLQVLLGSFSIIPLLAGAASAEHIAQTIQRFWTDPGTRAVISSDLSHYLDSSAARRLDESTARAIESLEPEAIRSEQACGRIPICGLLLAAKSKALKPAVLDLRNSGDTSGPTDQVVGYGAFAFSP